MERFSTRASLLHGVLAEIESSGPLVSLLNNAGKMSSHMGFVKVGSGGTKFIYPEEAVFLIEQGKLEVKLKEDSEQIIGSVQEAYFRLLTDVAPLTSYIVYAHLARSGYKVLIKIRETEKFGPLRIFDVHTPSTQFSRTHPPPPKFRAMKIFKWDQGFPGLAELTFLREESNKLLNDAPHSGPQFPIKIAIVAHDGDVSFYSINCPSNF